MNASCSLEVQHPPTVYPNIYHSVMIEREESYLHPGLEFYSIYITILFDKVVSQDLQASKPKIRTTAKMKQRNTFSHSTFPCFEILSSPPDTRSYHMCSPWKKEVVHLGACTLPKLPQNRCMFSQVKSYILK